MFSLRGSCFFLLPRHYVDSSLHQPLSLLCFYCFLLDLRFFSALFASLPLSLSLGWVLWLAYCPRTFFLSFPGLFLSALPLSHGLPGFRLLRLLSRFRLSLPFSALASCFPLLRFRGLVVFSSSSLLPFLCALFLPFFRWPYRWSPVPAPLRRSPFSAFFVVSWLCLVGWPLFFPVVFPFLTLLSCIFRLAFLGVCLPSFCLGACYLRSSSPPRSPLPLLVHFAGRGGYIRRLLPFPAFLFFR